MALALSEISIKQIEREIRQKSKFQKTIHITKYPDLSSMQQQHSLNWLSMSESIMNFSGNLLSKIPPF